jgi:hypothetical protein
MKLVFTNHEICAYNRFTEEYRTVSSSFIHKVHPQRSKESQYPYISYFIKEKDYKEKELL